MARKIDITKKKPSDVLKIIEKSPKIRRIEFGKCTDNKSKFLNILLHPIWGTLLLIFIWLLVHYVFIHKDFILKKDNGESYFIQYGAFLLASSWTYVIIFSQIVNFARYLYTLGVNKIKVKNEL